MLKLTVDSDGHIQGQKSWGLEEGHGYRASDGALTKSDTEDVIGIIQNCEIALAENLENGMHRGKLLADGSIQLIMIQPGSKPVVIFEDLKRDL